MDVLCHKRARLGWLLGVAGCVVGAQEAPQPAAEPTQPPAISLDAESSSFDRMTNRMVFKALRIEQGDLSIEADEAEATELDFEASEWLFTSNVRIVMRMTTIAADRAQFTFQGHELSYGELSGDPAVFEAFSVTRGHAVRGGAGSLSYDSRQRTLRMLGGAWISDGANEIRGCDLVYDLERETITSGSSECTEPFRMTIVPPANSEPAEPPGNVAQ